MDKLDAIFRTGFQPLEKTDSWLGIRRQDPEEGRKPKDRKKPDEDGEFGEDHTILSVTALDGFLRQLLQQAGADVPKPAETPAEDGFPVAGINPELTPPTSEDPRYRAAASAYENAAHSTPRTAIPAAIPAATGGTPAIVLSDEEIQVIRAMLDDVAVLNERVIVTITLKPAPTFLQSLHNGVRDALN